MDDDVEFDSEVDNDEWVAVLLNSDFFCIDFFFFFLQTKIKSKIL